MIRLTLRFPAGRYHATPWDHHVNEGVPEWPPSPWRIVRALAAALYARCPAVDRTVALAALRKLAAPPSFTLPPATASHTRHYLAQNNRERTGRLVLDTFVAMDRDAELVVHWPCALATDERRAVEAMAGAVSYLGRAEAWCDARVMRDDEPAPAPDCEPSDGAAARDTATVRVLCPAGGFTEEDLCRTTGDVQREGWSDPPGTRWVFYRRRADALSPRHRPLGLLRPRRDVTVAELALGGPVLPLFTEAVVVAEKVRAALLWLHREPSAVFSGKDRDGRPLRDQHRHAHFVPEARGATNRVTHVTVYAPCGLGDSELAALAGLTYLTQDHGRPTLDVVLSGYGRAADFAGTSPLFRRARRWRSRTPFVLPRHVKRRGDRPAEQVARELALRGHPAPVRVDERAGVDLFDPRGGAEAATRWVEFRARRSGDRVTTGVAGFALEFAQEVEGPLLLGYGTHYGLGQFEACDDDHG